MEGENEVEKAERGYDEMNVTIIRLGLVLWEMETEQVPFAEQDAVTASRQIKAGVMPLIHNWEDAELASLVSEYLSLSPDDRPPLSDVKYLNRYLFVTARRARPEPRPVQADALLLAYVGIGADDDAADSLSAPHNSAHSDHSPSTSFHDQHRRGMRENAPLRMAEACQFNNPFDYLLNGVKFSYNAVQTDKRQ
ncbi:hypothetical protein BLNAU_4853 [Blattamonas nauphoetae]|uniref:Protein kinase domain-containing protein n=1 Tax=Blattamonas nauphoetae TaxID=2049346 RepID=A0ABQ9Y9A0_9EUKA|nr:hypothetical protein BLNAU_4853 [Blattamonas nauphoetae]